jgi:hypothetical protein
LQRRCEQQFQAYRALGFHAACRLFDRSDRFAHRDPRQNPDVQPQIELLDRPFPRAEIGRPHGQKQTFADWLQETASQCLSRVDARDWPLHAAGVKGLVTCR